MRNKFELEYTLNSSPKILFNRLSTPSGLAEWFADDINIQGSLYTFFWEGSGQQAELIKKKDNHLVRFKWLEEDDDEFFEFKINQHELTGDVALVVTDFADEDELDESKDLWDKQISKLKQTLGL